MKKKLGYAKINVILCRSHSWESFFFFLASQKPGITFLDITFLKSPSREYTHVTNTHIIIHINPKQLTS